MKQTTVAISFDDEKLSAIKKYMRKKDADLQIEMTEQLLKLYEKYVPTSIREYIDERNEDLPPTPLKRTNKSNNIQSNK